MLLLQLEKWEKYDIISSGWSREARGLQTEGDKFCQEGAAMNLLRQAVEQWSQRPHVMSHIREECNDGLVEPVCEQVWRQC